MKRLNQAFSASDAQAIVDLVRQWESSPYATAPVGEEPRDRARRAPGQRAAGGGRPRAGAARRGPRLRPRGDDGARDGRGGERHRPAGRVARVVGGGAGGGAQAARGAAGGMSEFLDDGRAALEWVEAYLDRVGELPVLAQVEPGDIRARLPASPPEQGEPFSAVLRDLDEVLLPGMTHWQHPRFFAYFADSRLAPGDPRRDARRRAQPGRVPVAHVAGLDRARGPGVRLGRAAARPAGGLARPHRGRGLDLDDGRDDRRAPRDGAQRRGRLRARALGARQGRAHARDGAAQGARRRRVPDARRRPRPLRRRDRRADGRDDLDRVGRPGGARSRTCASRPARGCTSTPPTRAARWCARSTAGRSRASSAPTRSSSTRTSGC